MNTFTCITLIRDSFHTTQHHAESPTAALRLHVALLPFDDADGPFDDELDWLLRVSDGTCDVEVVPFGDRCKNIWLWRDGAKHEPQYHTTIVKTDVTHVS